MNELLAEKDKLPKPVLKKETIDVSAAFAGGSYQLNVQRTILGNIPILIFPK